MHLSIMYMAQPQQSYIAVKIKHNSVNFMLSSTPSPKHTLSVIYMPQPLSI